MSGRPLQAFVDDSPRAWAQRNAIGATFGQAMQRQAVNTVRERAAPGRQVDAEVPARPELAMGDPARALAAPSADGPDTPGPASNRTGMPDRLRAGIESLSGMDLSDVRVHRNSSQPAQLHALAYAQGNDIHLGPGQEQHLPHEAWHVVQQRQGRVQATVQMAGVGLNDDVGLEREADVMGERALQTQAVVGSDRRPSSRVAASVVQRQVQTHGGKFETSRYESHYAEDVGEHHETAVGADIRLKFTPDASVVGGARAIGLTQTVKSMKSTQAGPWEPFTPPDSPLKVNFKLSADEGDVGRGIDVKDSYDDAGDTETSTNPMYGVFNRHGKVSKHLADTWPDVGFAPRNLLTGAAELYDNPRTTLDFAAQGVSMQFEATAIILDGALRGAYLGSIAWGWEKAEGNETRPLLKPTTIEKLSDGIPTANFLRAAQKWNEWNGGKRPSRLGQGDLNAVKLPIPTLDRDLVAQAPSVSKLAELLLARDELTREDETPEIATNLSNLDVAIKGLATHLVANKLEAERIQEVSELGDRFASVKGGLRYELKLPLMMNRGPLPDERREESRSSDQEEPINLDDL